jgi:hypothetical protein
MEQSEESIDLQDEKHQKLEDLTPE